MEELFKIVGPDDPRTSKYFLVESRIAPFIIVGLYVTFVLKWGQELMKNREPFQLKKTLMIYNWLQIILNTYVCVESTRLALDINPFCGSIDTSLSPRAMRTAKFMYYYYGLKILDLMDTMFFILRKKNNQISTLHVYHHSGMIFTGYGGTRFFPGGQGYYLVPINTFVHIVMYFYYFMTAWRPAYGQIVWWKKYITQLQILQHLILIVIFATPILCTDCYPKTSCYLFLPNLVTNVSLFISFYRKNFVAKSKSI